MEAATQQTFSRLAESFMHIAGDCPLVAHLALAAMLRDMAGSPEMTYLATVELPRLGPLVQAQQRSMLDLFCEFLGPGFAAMGRPAPDPPTVSLCIGGGIEEVVRDHALRGRLRRAARRPAGDQLRLRLHLLRRGRGDAGQQHPGAGRRRHHSQVAWPTQLNQSANGEML